MESEEVQSGERWAGGGGGGWEVGALMRLTANDWKITTTAAPLTTTTTTTTTGWNK